MAAVDQENANCPKSGVLLEAFQITGRGCVGVFAELQGTIHIGDCALFPDRAYKVTGIEMIRYADPTKRPRDSVGLLLDGAEKDAVLAFKGTRIGFEAGAA